MRRIALEVPLPLLAVRRRPEGYDDRAARVQRLEDALDRAALAGGIRPSKSSTMRSPVCLIQALELDQLEVQAGRAPSRIPCA
jgi:hypothetical protein